ncbi:hypothetical protein SAMN04489761_2230 [Tenacibaculum sp. MAR_2009_124]|uniref:hypothetical protein n=1 Tax=Tenacibaculum sp. MAR_2009_124 TaxID=1250059 RepID=UPI000894578E|nr:hypothetical protein [Tenacibaculum sp. MAR_2009_124]SEC00615.1 hypothetical protein SAMN04489761_2230 [Tenacibaculum sp. MAR_2009_124]
MEKYSNTDSNETLVLTKYVFTELLNQVIDKFKEDHKVQETYKDSQLYGFGNYNSNLPSIKSELELLLKGYVNGKYLYNKSREVSTGKPVVKISREYKFLFFNYLDCKDVFEFLEKRIKLHDEREKQLQLLHSSVSNEDYYYVCYYYGEDKRMTKGQIIIYNNWKTFELIFVYQNRNGLPIYYNLFGNIKQESSFVHFDAKFFTKRGKIEGANFIFYVGKSNVNERPILIGTYSSFDKYDHSVAGNMIMVRKDSREAMEEEANSFYFDPVFSQELVKERYVALSHVPKQLSRLSSKSPYASIFGKIPNNYKAIFSIDNEKHELSFLVEEFHYNIRSRTENVVVENDRLSLENKGQILELHFSLVGIFYIQKVSIYMKVYNLFQTSEVIGRFTGVDINNNIVSGDVQLTVLP